MPVPGFCKTNRIVQLLLNLVSLVQFFQTWNEIHQSRDYEYGNKEPSSPMSWIDVTIANSTHCDQDEVVGVKERDFHVNSKEMMKNTCPGD